MCKIEVANGVDSCDGFVYMVVTLEDLTLRDCVSWRPTKACKTNFLAKKLVDGCSTLGDPASRIDNNAQHFKYRVLQKTAWALRVEHRRFGIANNAWTNGTKKRIRREVIRSAKTILIEHREPSSERIVVVLPVVPWALNTACRQRLGMSPCQTMLRREPRNEFAVLVEEDAKGIQSGEPIDRGGQSAAT